MDDIEKLLKIGADALEKGDQVRYRQGSSYPEEVEILGFSKDRKLVSVEKKHYSSFTGNLVGGSQFTIETKEIVEVQRWVKVSPASGSRRREE